MAITHFDPTEELHPLPVGEPTGPSFEVHEPTNARPLVHDVYRVGDELFIDFDVPGIDPETIRLSLEDRVLVVAVEREFAAAGVDVIERGRAHGRFEQRLHLPRQWGVGELRASCANGVLRVCAPYVRPSAARPIEIATPVAAASPIEPPTPGRHENGQHAELFEHVREPVGSTA